MNRGLALFWNGVIFLNRLSRGRPMSAKEESDLRGWSGAINVAIEGPEGGEWRIEVAEERCWISRGAHTSPRASIRMDPVALFSMVSGRASIFSLNLTGAVTTTGEGLSGIMLWAIISRVRALAASRGPAGWLASLWLRRALALSGTGLTEAT